MSEKTKGTKIRVICILTQRAGADLTKQLSEGVDIEQ